MQTLQHTNTHEGALKKCNFHINCNCNKKSLARLLTYIPAQKLQPNLRTSGCNQTRCIYQHNTLETSSMQR